MEKLFKALLRRRSLVLVITAVLLVVSVISLTKTTLNTDVARYLPDDSSSKQAISILRDEFDINGDAEICAQGSEENYDELSGLVEQITALDSVDEVQWLGSYEGLFEFDGESVLSTQELIPDENVRSLLNHLFFEYEGESYYIITISLKAANATLEAGDALDEITDIIQSYSLPYELGGTAVQSNDMLDSALGELPIFILVAGVVILVILIVCTKTFASALIILLSIAISILFNMGTNIFTEDISIVTFSIAAILQLALSMDYSIFLTHAFEEERKHADDTTAMIKAVKKTLVVILASALTTIAGFCALFAMKYTMGADLGLCLAKGVALSFLTVIIIQPCIMLCLRKLEAKTKHKYLNPQFAPLSRLPKKVRGGAPLLAAVLFIPMLICSLGLNYYYLDSGYDPDANGPKGASQSMGTQAVFIVETVSAEKQFELSEKVGNLDNVTGVTGYYALISELTDGASLPIYSSLTEQTGDTLMFELELKPAELLAAADGDTTALEDRISAKVESYATRELTALVTQALADEAAAQGRPLTADEQQAVIDSVSAEFTDELTGLVESQLTEFEESLGFLDSDLTEYKDKFFATIDGVEHTFFTVKILGESEGEQALDTLEAITYTIEYVLGTDTVYSTGSTQSVKDLAETTETDFLLINGLSALLIFIILFFTFKDFLTSILLIALIELAIFINLSINVFTGTPLNFMTYIIISAIQLGATIDYAILMTKNYRMRLQDSTNYEAIRHAVMDSAFPIMTSALILSGACFSVYFVASDPLIREITLLIARGAIISAIIVLFVLPATLAVLTPRLHKKKELW